MSRLLIRIAATLALTVGGANAIGAQVLSPGVGTGASAQAQTPNDCFWFCTNVLHPIDGTVIGHQCNNYGYGHVVPEHGFSCIATSEWCILVSGNLCDGPLAVLTADGVPTVLANGCSPGNVAAAFATEMPSHGGVIVTATNWRAT